MMRFHHVGIEVRDVDRSVAFYRSVGGFEVEQRLTLLGEEIAFLRLGEFRLELYQGEEAGATHVCYEVEDIEPYLQRLPLLEGPLLLENGWQTAFFQGENGEVLELLKRADTRVTVLERRDEQCKRERM